MKLVRLLLVLGALAVVGVFGYEFQKELQKPAEGEVMITADDEVIVVEEVVVMEEVVVEEEVMEEEVVEVEEVFMPLAFNGKKLSSFAAANGGVVVKIEGAFALVVKNLGIDNYKSKGVKVNGDLYFKAGKDLYVIHGGKLIKL